jgi:hypothetical protein
MFFSRAFIVYPGRLVTREGFGAGGVV